MHSIVLALLVAVAATSPAGTSPTPKFFIHGHGTHACERFSAWQPMDVAQHDPYLQWMLGFVTGVGSMRVRLANDGAGAMWDEVKAFCADHPDSDFATAVGRLTESLHRRSSADDRFIIHGVGVADCATFRAGLDGEAGGPHGAYAQWPAGFATGVGSAGVPLRHSHVGEIAGWLDAQCREDPSAQAAAAMARMLERRLHQGED